MNAVIYARYSSVGQRDVSIEDQVREIQHYALTHKLTIINVYADRAKTGRNDKRPQFRKMIQDAEKGMFKTVLVYKHDRFARNQYDAIVYKHRLKEAGVKVIAVMEPLPEGNGAKILESIYLAMAEEYSENLSQNVKRGLRGNALKCIANSMPSFGYRVNKETKKYEIEPEEAPIVRTIFEMTLAGKTLKEVRQYLESLGKRHSNYFAYRILRNERYIGTYICGDVRIEGGMPQIVSKEVFEKVRKIMEKRKHNPQLRPYQYAFSGKIFCGYCGSLMSGEYAVSHTGKKYSYYVCIAHKKRKNDCEGCRVDAEMLEVLATEALRNTIFVPDIIERLSSDVYNCLMSSLDIKTASLRAELSDTESRIRNIQKNIEKVPDVPEILIERLRELDKIKKDLSAKIESEQVKVAIPIDYIKRFILSCKDKGPEILLETFVTKITVFSDHAVLEYDASGDNEISFEFEPHKEWRSSALSCSNLLYSISHGRLFVKFYFAA